MTVIETETVPSAGHDAHEALRTLYHFALSGDGGSAERVTAAYLLLVEYMSLQGGSVHPERVSAMGRLLLESGDITPMGARMLDKLAEECR